MSKSEETESKVKEKFQRKLDDDTLSYFKRVESVIKDDDFENGEAKELFVENVFAQVEGRELALCCDQVTSRVFERLLVFFNNKQLKVVWENLSKDFITVTTDRFGSHVVQNLVNSIPRAIRFERNELKFEDENAHTIDSIEQVFISYCLCINDNLQDIVEDTYGSHVIRAVFEILSGLHTVDTVQRSRNSRGCRKKAFKMEDRNFVKVNLGAGSQVFGTSVAQKIAVPESFVSVLKELTTNVLNMDLRSFAYNPLSCPILQTLLLVQREKDDKLCSKLCKKIMNLICDDNQDNKSQEIPSILTDSVSSHLVEKVLHVASPKQHKTFFKKFFKGHLGRLSLHPVCNYLVQHILSTTSDPAMGGAMIDELLVEVEEILSCGHDGVVARMAEMSVRLEAKQQELQEAILEAFHCSGKKERKKCAPLILSMTTYDMFFGDEKQEDDTEKKQGDDNKDSGIHRTSLKRINYHGAVLLKIVLDFQKPKVFVNSLLKISKDDVTKTCRDPIGSRTIEALLNSQTVAIEKKNKLCYLLKGEFAALACDKSASHVVESCWRVVDSKHKELIAKELTNQHHMLTKDFYGSKVLKNCFIDKSNEKHSNNEKEFKTRKRQKSVSHSEISQDASEIKAKRVKNQDKMAMGLYTREMAVLGFEQTSDDLNNNKNDLSEKSKNAKKQKGKKNLEDEIDLIFESRKPRKN